MTRVDESTEALCRAWVASLGDLSEWKRPLAQTAIVIGRLIDAEIDPVKAAAGSRELRQIIGLLAPTASLAGVPRPESWSRPEPPVDSVGNLVDLVVAKQQRTSSA